MTARTTWGILSELTCSVTPSWFKWHNKNKKCGKLVPKELYDHRKDDFENENVAEQIEYKTVIEKMARLLKKKLSENKC